MLKVKVVTFSEPCAMGDSVFGALTRLHEDEGYRMFLDDGALCITTRDNRYFWVSHGVPFVAEVEKPDGEAQDKGKKR